MPREDEDVSEGLRTLPEDEGIAIHLDAGITRVSGQSGDSVRIVVEHNGAEHVLAGSRLLVATGRTPNTEGPGFELAGVELTDRGYVKVNERLQTTAYGVWAIGEVAGSPQSTISASTISVWCMTTSGVSSTSPRAGKFRIACSPTRNWPASASTRIKPRRVRLFKLPMAAVLRAHSFSETRGFLKALVEAEGDRILGFTAFGVGAGEVMSAVEIAMIAGLPYTALRNAVLTHSTFVEGLFPLFSSAASIHSAAGATAVPRGLGESGQSGRPHLGDVPRRGVSSTGVRYARASTRPMLS